ncbi:MAG TPA: aldolase/citrate lyase family protein [Thermoleophilaceae bacterium]|jgi:citrate lyase beta subunit
MLSSPPHFVLTLWTDDPERAREADAAGVDRIGLDLERIGKRERQADPALWQTSHEEASLPLIGASLTRAKLFARTNPPHPGWADEAERLIAAGAEVLMLPAFRSAADVREALGVVAGHALLVPLIETAEALADVRAIASIDGLREAHFGLNDLAIGMRLANRFDVLGRPELEHAAHALADAGLRVGVGGIGRALDDSLPIPSDRIYAQYPRLHASAALIARSFFAGLEPGPAPLAAAVAAARERLAYWYRPHGLAVGAAA